MIQSSRIQAAVVALIVACVAVANKALHLGLDATDIGGIAAAGAALVLAIAHIDNGEPAEPQAPVVLNEQEKSLAKQLLTPGLAAKLGLALLAAFCVVGCGSIASVLPGVNSPQFQADDATLKADFAVLKTDIDAAKVVVPGIEALAADVAGGNYPGAVVELLAVIPQIQATAPGLLAQTETVVRDVERLVSDATSKVAVVKAKAMVAKAKAATNAAQK